MLFSYIFRYLESFFVVFYPSFIFHSGEMPARATPFVSILDSKCNQQAVNPVVYQKGQQFNESNR